VRARRGERRRAGSAPVTSADRRERRLRRIVRRMDACLPAIADAQRQVLVLRAGLGTRPARSRGEVAQLLGVRGARVARLERRGVRTLRRLDRATNCAPGAGPPAMAEGVAVLAGLGAPFGSTAAGVIGGTSAVLATTGAGTAPAGAEHDATKATAGGDGGTGADDVKRASATDQGGVAGASAEQPATVLPPSRTAGVDQTPAVLLLLALLGLLGFGLRALRETRS
jgi:hypothetical protein